MDLRTSHREPSWGAEQSGLITGFEFLPGQMPRPVDSDSAAALLAGPEATDGRFLWLHFDLAHAGAVRWLERHASMPEGFFEAMGSPVRSTRVERDDEALVAVVNDVMFDFDFDPGDLATLWVGLDRHLVVTGRQQRLRSIDALRTRIKGGQPLASPMALLEHLLHENAKCSPTSCGRSPSGPTRSKTACWPDVRRCSAPRWARCGDCWCGCSG